MLKLPHVQARLSVQAGKATVKQMSLDEPEDLRRAEELIALFGEARLAASTRDALYARLSDYTGTRLDYREIDGLAKVICDTFATFEPDIPLHIPHESADTAAPGQQDANANKEADLDSLLANPLPLPSDGDEAASPAAGLSAFRLATWRVAARSEFYPFQNAGLTVALRPGVQSLRRAAAAHDEELLGRLLPWAKRAAILRQAADECGVGWTPAPGQAEVGSVLFGDLPGRHRLVALSPDLNAANLLNRYNVELLRGVLYLAPRLRIVVRDKYKDLFKYIKFFGLMHDLKPLPFGKPKLEEGQVLAENEIGGYEIVLEGASSPFLARSDRRYGIQFARFLPALLLCEAEWQLEAELVFVWAGGSGQSKGKARVTRALYRLGPQPHLRTHFKGSGEFDSQLEASLAAAFEERFKTTTRKPVAPVEVETEVARTEENPAPPRKRRRKPPKKPDERKGWSIKREDRIVPVYDTVMIPDFAFEHSDGRRALLEVVGFWERGYLERKIAKLNRAGRSDIIVLVSERTRCGRENFLSKGQEPPYQLLFFKGTPRLGPILDALERCAVPGQPAAPTE